MSGSSLDNASLNDEDETIRQLDESGDLGAVVGSQSMLTQEIATLDDKDDTPTNEQASMAALLSQQLQDDPEADSPSNSQPPSVVSEDNGLSKHKQPDDDAAGVSCTGGTQDDAADPDETVFHSEIGASNKRKRRGDSTEAAEKPPEYAYQHHHFTRRRRLLVEEQVKSLQDEKTLQDTLVNSNMGSLLDAVQLLEDAAAAREARDKDDTSQPLSQPAIVENLLPYSQESIQDSQRAVERLLDDDDDKKHTPDYSKPPFVQPARKQHDEDSSATKSNNKSTNKTNKKPKVHRHVQRAKKRAELEKVQQQAQRAVELAQSAIHDEELGKQLLYRMALVRENPRTPPDSWPPADTTIPDGFFWAHYPPLEGVLKEHMKEYYKYSMELCQSGYQQAFNNRLVEKVLKVATEHQWNFGPRYTHKVLRDRIRCYYKTHIQNAKKRLRTMLRNPTKRANARHLCQHLELLDEYQRATRGQTPSSNEPSKQKESPKKKKTQESAATEKENRKVASDDEDDTNNNKKPSSKGTTTPKVASDDLCQQAIRVSQV